MKFSSFGAVQERLPRRAQEVSRLAMALGRSSSRLEDAFWQSRLYPLAEKMLSEGKEDLVTAALDFLYQKDASGYEALLGALEEVSCEREIADGKRTLFLMLPVLAWSRSEIPWGAISPESLAEVRSLMEEELLCPGVPLVLADALFAPNQMPQGYSATLKWAEKLAQRLDEGVLHVSPKSLTRPELFLADSRCLLGAVAVRPGEPFFRWHEEQIEEEEALRRWQKASQDRLASLFGRCAIEVLLPNACFSAWRTAQRASRSFHLRGCVAFLTSTYDIAPQNLKAVVAACHDPELVEWRVGFAREGDEEEILEGVVWGLVEGEDERTDAMAEIRAILEQVGMKDIIFLPGRFPALYCEECQAPLFPTPKGEFVHAGPSPENEISTRLH